MSRHGIGVRAVILMVLMSAGCGEASTGDSGPSMTGDWSGGTVPGPGVFLHMDLALTDDDGSLIGTGLVNGTGVNCSVTASGTRDNDEFTVSMGCPGYAGWSFTGTATNQSLNGRLNGTGFVNQVFQMIRQ